MLVKIAPYADVAIIYAFDAQAAAGIERLRKHFVQQFADLLGIQGRCRHVAPDCAGAPGLLVIDRQPQASTRPYRRARAARLWPLPASFCGSWTGLCRRD